MGFNQRWQELTKSATSRDELLLAEVWLVNLDTYENDDDEPRVGLLNLESKRDEENGNRVESLESVRGPTESRIIPP